MKAPHASPSPTGGRIITFYSYKGGTGRTMLMANVGWILASRGCRVLVVDWDLEAPGLHRYYHPFLIDPELENTDGIIDMVLDYATEAVTAGEAQPADWYLRQADVLRFACSLDYDFDDGGTLDLLPAGRQGASYSTRVNTFDWRNFYERQGGGAFLEAVRSRMRETYDYVLIDSRTGVSDTSGICTVQMPDALVVCFTLNNQSIEGAAGIVTSVNALRPGSDFDIFPVPTRVETAEKDKLEQRRALARSRLALCPTSIPPGRAREEYWGAVEMPYVPYYAYEEILTTFGDRAGQPTSLLAAAERVTGYLTGGRITSAAVLPEPVRLELVERYAPKPRDIPDDRLSIEAEAVYSRLDAAQQTAARRLMTRLVRPGRPNEGDDVPISAPVADVGDLMKAAHPFLTAGILVVQQDPVTGEQVVRMANPALIRRWQRLRNWVAEDRNFLAWAEQVRYGSTQWAANERDTTMLLSSTALHAALRYHEERAAELGAKEHEYILASASVQRRRRLLTFVGGTTLAAVLLLAAVSILQGRRVSESTARLDMLTREGYALLEQGQTDSARSRFQRAIDLHQLYRPAYIGLGQAMIQAGDDAQAVSALSKAIELDSTSADVWSLRGAAFAVGGRHREAIADYSAALERGADSAEVLFNRGLAYQTTDDRGSAIRDFLYVATRTGDSGRRQAATARLAQLGVDANPAMTAVQARIHMHYTAAEDEKIVQAAIRELERAGFTLASLEQRSEPTRGDVRSFHAADAALAEDVAAVLEKALAGNGYPLRLQRLRPDSARFAGVPRGQVEVWLPSLARSLVRPNSVRPAY